MNVLALDSSSKYFSLVIAKDDTIVSRIFEPYQRELSRKIIPALSRALKKSGLSLKDIDCFGVGLGPGSFTGLRVGLAALKGLTFSLDRPGIAVASLDVIANSVKSAGAKTAGIICPIIDAKRKLVYSAIYQLKNNCIQRKSKYLLVPLEDLLARLKSRTKVLFLGDAIPLYGDIIRNKLGAGADFSGEDYWYPRPEILLSCVQNKIRDREFADLDKIVPLYLYPKECQINKIV